MRLRLAFAAFLLIGVSSSYADEVYQCTDRIVAGIQLNTGVPKIINVDNIRSIKIKLQNNNLLFSDTTGGREPPYIKYTCNVGKGEGFLLYKCQEARYGDTFIVFNTKELRYNRALMHITIPIEYQTPINMATGTCVKL